MTDLSTSPEDSKISPIGFFARTANKCRKLWRLCRRRPLLPRVTALGVLLVAVLIWNANDVRASVDGCVDREQGARQSEQIQRGRVAAITLGDSRLAQIYAKEAKSQEEGNREAERRCGQPGIPFDLAMRRIDAKRDFLNLLAVTLFGFCTLASVLIAVALRDDGLDERPRRSSITDQPATDEGAVRDSVVEQGVVFLSSSASPMTANPHGIADAGHVRSRTGRWPIGVAVAFGAVLGTTLSTVTASRHWRR